MGTQTIHGPHREVVSKLLRILFNHFRQGLGVCFICFRRSPTARFDGQSVNPVTTPAIEPEVNRGLTDRLHLGDLLGFMSKMKEAYGCTSLPHRCKRSKSPRFTPGSIAGV